MRIKRIGLEHHGKVAVGGALAAGTGAADADIAVVLLFQAGDDAQQGAFATPRRADQRHEFPVGNIERDAFQNLRGAKGFADILDNDSGHGPLPRCVGKP